MTTTAVMRKEATLSHGKTRYLEAGTGDPVVLVHGVAVAGGADDWRPVIDLLSQKYRVIAPDMLGWPPSDTKENMQAFPNLTDHLREFMDVLGLKKAHVIGATMGGWIAGLFAYESPERVDKLVITGNPGFHGAPNDRLAQVEVPSKERVAEAIAKVSPMLSASEQAAIVDEKVAKMAEPGFFDAFGSMMKTMADHRNRKEYVLTRRLPHTPVPVLFLIGRGDPSSEVADKLKAMTPGSSLYIIETGAHQVHYENTEEFCKATSDFLG